MIKQSSFFTPWIGKDYEKGLGGIKTLVLGTAHVCLIQCRYKDLCCSPSQVAQMDHLCPCYSSFQGVVPNFPEEEMCLHNSNYIELVAYCDDEAGYPAYSNFTHYLLKCKGYVSPDEKNDLWQHLAFTNLLQCFIPTKCLPPFDENKDLYLQALPQLKELLQQIQPQQIFVIGQEAAIALSKSQIHGLRQESLMPEHPTMDLYLFSYNTKPLTPDIDLIRQHLTTLYPERAILPRRDAWSSGHTHLLENVLLKAMKRGIVIFSDGHFVINPDRPEKEGGHFVYLLYNLYNFNSYDDLDKLIVKYNKQGRPMSLRQIRHYNNTIDENMLSYDIERLFFKSK